MADQNILTPDEQAFFNSGELTPNLAAEQAANQAAAEAQANAEAAALAAQQSAVSQAPAAQQPVQTAADAEFLRQALLQEQRTRAQLEAQLQQLATQQQPRTQELPAPDPENDPLGAMLHQLGAVNRTVAELQQRITQQQLVQDQTNNLVEFQSSMKGLRDQFVQTTPDFDVAYQHLRTVRADDMRMLGMPDSRIQQVLLQDEITLAQTALQQGKNPAEIVYAMAKRHGYTPTASAVLQQAASKVANIKAGQEAARTIDPSPQPAENLTMAGLKTASDADLDKLAQSDDAWAKLMGVGGKSIF